MTGAFAPLLNYMKIALMNNRYYDASILSDLVDPTKIPISLITLSEDN